MDLIKKINELKQSIIETNQLVDELIASLSAKNLRLENSEKKVLKIKEEVKTNIEKIDEILKDYNANS